MIPILAGITSMLASKGLDLLSAAIDGGAEKAKEFIEEKTGISLDKVQELTPEQVAKLRELEISHETELKRLALDEKKEDNRHLEKVLEIKTGDTANARNTNVSIQTSENASPLSKNTAYYIDIALVVSTIILAFTLFLSELPTENKELAYMMFGSLLTLTGTVVNFHRGSSQSTENINTKPHLR